jgi:hypothetical protein
VRDAGAAVERHPDALILDPRGEDGLLTSFNPTFDLAVGGRQGWRASEHHGLDQGPVILMIENYRSGLLWRLMRECPAIAYNRTRRSPLLKALGRRWLTLVEMIKRTVIDNACILSGSGRIEASGIY